MDVSLYMKYIKVAKDLGFPVGERKKWVEDQIKIEKDAMAEERRKKDAIEAENKKAEEDKRNDLAKENQAQRDERNAERIFIKEKLDKELEIEKVKNADAKQKSPGFKEHYPRRLPPFSEKSDDIDAYLNRFSIHCISLGLPKDRWASQLIDLLTGKALKVLLSLSQEDSQNYDKLKNALLNAYQCNTEGFRNKFRSCKPEKDENFSTYLGRLKLNFQRWLDLAQIDSKDPDQIIDFMIMDQVYAGCHADLVSHLKERKPKDCDELCDVAERYATAHPNKTLAKFKMEPYIGNVGFQERGRSVVRNQSGQRTMSLSGDRKNKFQYKRRDMSSNQNRQANNACNRCGLIGHFAAKCKTPYCNDCEQFGHVSCKTRHSEQKQSEKCENCGRFGHKTQHCRGCFNCGRQGHKSRECRSTKHVYKQSLNVGTRQFSSNRNGLANVATVLDQNPVANNRPTNETNQS